MKKKLIAALSIVAAGALALSLAGCGGSSSSSDSSDSSSDSGATTAMRFVTGGESGTYYAFGGVLGQYATNGDYGVDITVQSGNGSKANVEALQDGDAEIAFCQSDVLAYAYEGTNLFDGAGYQDFSIVAALYGEQVQIVTCDSSIKTVADLKGKKVSIGATGSGVNFNAVDILGAYGLTTDDIDAQYLDFADSADSLKDGTIDAAFIVAGAPTTAITDLSTSKQAYLVSMDEEHVNKLIESSPYYAAATISKDAYGLDEDVQTVQVLAVIIANDSVSEDAIYGFVKSIFDGAEDNADAHAKYAELNLEQAASITTVPYHAGAAKYFEEQGITVESK